MVCFLLVTLINSINEFAFYKRNNKFSKLLLTISVFILCFVAGVRASTVGTDVNVYVARLMEVSSNITNIVRYIQLSGSDLLFAVVVFIGNLFGDIHFTLFLIELVAVIPIYILAYRRRDYYSFTGTILIYLLTMYCISLNLMRQSVAMSICILAYDFYSSSKRKKAILLVLVAALFHKTAMIFFVIFILENIIVNDKKNKPILLATFLASIVIVSVFMERIVSLTFYARYLDLTEISRGFSMGSLVKNAIWILLAVFYAFLFSGDKEIEIIQMNTLLAIIYMSLTITSFKIPGTGRLGYYFINLYYFNMVPIFRKLFSQKLLASILFFILLAYLWWHMTAVPNDASGVYPYISDLYTFLN